MSIEKIESITITQYKGKVYNLEVEPNHLVKDDQFYLDANTGIIIHNCHPRDNIALRSLTQKLDMGYDFFGFVMKTREMQAKFLAEKCYEASLDERGHPSKKVAILGKSYKENIDLIDGSYSILISSYLDDMHIDYMFIDPNLNLVEEDNDPKVYLLAHWPSKTDWIMDYSFVPDSTVICPWREYTTNRVDLNVIHVGIK